MSKYHISIPSFLFFFLFTICIGNAQSLPFDFESSVVTADFVDFDGGMATVIANPQMTGINTSATVAQIIRNGGEIWSGSKVELDANLDFSTDNSISMKVFTTAPIGTVVKFKLEGTAGSTERDQTTTVTGEWETITWDFTGVPSDFNFVVFMFDFGNVGDGSQNSTFLFDDVMQSFGGNQIDLPVDFEGSDVNYTTTDFGGNVSMLVADPTNASNTVVQAIKTDQAATWAGTTIGTSAGFATNIPLTLTDPIISVLVWSPEANTPIRLKVEDSNDPTHTCETEINTTLAGEWEVLDFDFSNQAPGTAALSDGLAMGWTYNMASIFFNFGTEGATAGEKTYYFDNVQFGPGTVSTKLPQIEGLKVFPNPSKGIWNISSDKSPISFLELFDVQGKLLLRQNVGERKAQINAPSLPKGIYICKITGPAASSIVKLFKD